MEANSESENNKQPSKPKRQMKTPFQLETLETAYAAGTYPTEAMLVELSEKLGLTDRQLRMWFCHRRLKDKKENNIANKPLKVGTLPESPVEKMRAVGPECASDYGSVTGSGSSHFMEPKKVVWDDGPMTQRYYESPPRSIPELRVIECVEAQLGEPLREDGPILGVEFDPLPPDAFGAPIAEATEQQNWSEYSYEGRIYEQHNPRSSKDPSSISVRPHMYRQVALPSYRDPSVNTLRGRASLFLRGEETLSRVHGVTDQMSHVHLSSQQDKEGSEDTDFFHNAEIFHNDVDLHLDRKRKSNKARIAREVEAHENHVCEELDDQDNPRWKTRKEMEWHDRETRKEEDRLMRERQQEERLMHLRRHELEQREKFLQKEYLRDEKRRQKEERRREFEVVKCRGEMAVPRRIAKNL